MSYRWEKGSGRDVVLNFMKTPDGGYPKLNLYVNEKEKRYLQEKAWDNVALNCEYGIDTAKRNSMKDCDILLEAIQRLNRLYNEKKQKG